MSGSSTKLKVLSKVLEAKFKASSSRVKLEDLESDLEALTDRVDNITSTFSTFTSASQVQFEHLKTDIMSSGIFDENSVVESVLSKVKKSSQSSNNSLISELQSQIKDLYVSNRKVDDNQTELLAELQSQIKDLYVSNRRIDDKQKTDIEKLQSALETLKDSTSSEGQIPLPTGPLSQISSTYLLGRITFLEKKSNNDHGITRLTADVSDLKEQMQLQGSSIDSLRSFEDSIEGTNQKTITLQEIVDQLRSKISSLTDSSSKLTDISSKVRELTVNQDGFSKRMASIIESSSIQEELTAKLLPLLENVERLQEDDAQFKSSISEIPEINSKIESLHKGNARNTTSISKLQSDTNSISVTLSGFADKIASIQSTLAGGEDNEKFSGLLSEINLLKTTTGQQSNTSDSLSSKVTGIQLKLSSLESEQVDTKTKLSSFNASTSQIESLKNSVSKHGGSLDVLSSKIDGIQNKYGTYDSDQNELKSKINSLSGKLSDSHLSITRLESKVDSSNETLNDLSTRTSSSENKIAKLVDLQNGISRLEAKQMDTDDSVISLSSRVDSGDGKITQLQKLITSIPKYDSDIQGLNSRVDSNNSKVSELQKLIASIPKYDSDIQGLNSRVDSGDGKITQLQKLIASIPKYDSDIQGLNSRVDSNNSKVSELQKNVSTLSGEPKPTNYDSDIQSITSALNALKTALDSLKENNQGGSTSDSLLDTLKADIDTLKASQGQVEVVIPSYDVTMQKVGGKYVFGAENGTGFNIIPGYNALSMKTDNNYNSFQTSRGKNFVFSNNVNVPSLKSFGSLEGNSGKFSSLTIDGDIKFEGKLGNISYDELKRDPLESFTRAVNADQLYKIKVSGQIHAVRVILDGWDVPSSYDTYTWRYDSGNLEIKTGKSIGNLSGEPATSGTYQIFAY